MNCRQIAEVQQAELSQECLLWDTCCRIHVHLTTGSHAAPIRADNGNLGKFGATFQYGTVFAPKESLYEKEATGMKSLKN